MNARQELTINQEDISDQKRMKVPALGNASFLCFTYEDKRYVSLRDIVKYIYPATTKPQHFAILIATTTLTDNVIFLRRGAGFEMPLVPAGEVRDQVNNFKDTVSSFGGPIERKVDELAPVLGNAVLGLYRVSNAGELDVVDVQSKKDMSVETLAAQEAVKKKVQRQHKAEVKKQNEAKTADWTKDRVDPSPASTPSAPSLLKTETPKRSFRMPSSYVKPKIETAFSWPKLISPAPPPYFQRGPYPKAQ